MNLNMYLLCGGNSPPSYPSYFCFNEMLSWKSSYFFPGCHTPFCSLTPLCIIANFFHRTLHNVNKYIYQWNAEYLFLVFGFRCIDIFFILMGSF